ncbi:sugar transferase [Verrucomicrobiota bacterium sgz303538]
MRCATTHSEKLGMVSPLTGANDQGRQLRVHWLQPGYCVSRCRSVAAHREFGIADRLSSKRGVAMRITQWLFSSIPVARLKVQGGALSSRESKGATGGLGSAGVLQHVLYGSITSVARRFNAAFGTLFPDRAGSPATDGAGESAQACSHSDNVDAATACVSGFPRWKRILDFVCVLLASPIWLPIMILVALWIRGVSPGPIFYRQERIGYRERRFKILKFRSMKVDAETKIHENHLTHLIKANCPMKKLDAAGDPRLILGGRILRALGMDELPQLINVIRGEMSLVGPRPCTPHEFQHYEIWQKERVNTPPGLTGYWQVNGKNKTTFNQMIQMDLFYARNRSPWLDLQIMCKTVPAIVAQITETRKVKLQENARSV